MSVYAVTPAEVLRYLQLNPIGPTSQYDEGTIGSNVLAAQNDLEFAIGRFLLPRTFADDAPWATTTMNQAQVPIWGFRSFSRVTWGGTVMTVGLPGDGSSPSCWAIPDAQQTGQFIALQFRAWRVDNNRPWYLSDPLWWDKALDSPFYPGNWGGGYAFSSLPNDLLISGEAGFAEGTLPFGALHAVKVLAAFYTQRPASILADVAITPQGGVVTYSQMPAEVQNFIKAWRHGGAQAVSVG